VLRLPVAELDVQMRMPNGADDIVLLEADALDLRAAIALLTRIVERVDNEPLDWERLAMADVDVLLLRLRQRMLGDIVRSEVLCTGTACGTRVDVEFSIYDYLEHHRPRTPAKVSRAADGWFRLDDVYAEFRLPCVADQLAVTSERRPEQALLHLCVRPAEAADGSRRPVEAAMAKLAPNLASELRGTCPECGATVRAYFDPLAYTLRELRDQASFVYEDVCFIARFMHWSEADILAMPTSRRARYAELAQLQMAAGR
jgi:hypothetical protein